MESKSKVLGHPLHPMLVVFPLGLLVASFIFDIMVMVTGNEALSRSSFHIIAAGIIGGLVAALPGLIDWFAIPRGTRAKKIGAVHGLGNVIVLVLFAISWWLRRHTPQAPGSDAITFSFLGVLLGAVTGWLGGELVDRLGVGVDRGANLNAPNSLRHAATAPTAGERYSDNLLDDRRSGHDRRGLSGMRGLH
jgi:uncharacterized membrane protein